MKERLERLIWFGLVILAMWGTRNADAAYQPWPVNMMGLINGACPSGFSEFTSAQGRYLVGTPSGGTQGGTVGTAMADLAPPDHTHNIPSMPLSDTSSLSWAAGDIGLNNTAGSLGWYDGASFFNAGTASAGTRATNPGGTPSTTSGGTSATVAPLIQLRVCKKN